MTGAEKLIALRHATRGDMLLLANLGLETFSETFGPQNTPENMARYLADSFGPEIQANELSDERVIYLIAEVDQNPMGFVKLMASTPDPAIHGPKPYELVRIYARTSWIGHGVGSTLMSASLAEAVRLGYETLWLGVWEHNSRGIAFYKKWGFTVSGTHNFQLGDEAQTDFVMERPVVLPR